MDVKDNNEIECLVKNFLNQINKGKYAFPESTKVLEDVNKLYMIDKSSSEIVALISGSYLLSLYSLEYLKRMNQKIEEKYSVMQLTLSDFDNKDKIEEVKKEVAALEDEPFIKWVTNVCLIDLKKTYDNLDINNVHNLHRLGHVINLSLNELKNENAQDIELYDIHYRFQKRLSHFEFKDNTVTHLFFDNIKWEETSLNTKSIEFNNIKNNSHNKIIAIYKRSRSCDEENGLAEPLGSTE